jgi:hypothetical protein
MIAGALCALAGAAGFVAPPTASAMTSEELATICSSVFAEIGDPSVCIDSFSSGWGGGSSVAVEIAPGVVEVVYTRPDPNRVSCGYGIDAARLVDCLRKRPPNRVLGLVAGEAGVQQVIAPLWGPAGNRKDSRPGSVKWCAYAQGTLMEARDSLREIGKLEGDRSAWDPAGNLLGKDASHELRQRYAEAVSWFPTEVVRALIEKMEELPRPLTDRHYLTLMRFGWELTKKGAKEDLKNPACGTNRPAV